MGVKDHSRGCAGQEEAGFCISGLPLEEAAHLKESLSHPSTLSEPTQKCLCIDLMSA